jgi:hypothetical protein
MRDPKPVARGVTGIAVLPTHHLAIGLGEQTVLFLLGPEELRALASELLISAEAIEADASAAVDAAFEKAKHRGPH